MHGSRRGGAELVSVQNLMFHKFFWKDLFLSKKGISAVKSLGKISFGGERNVIERLHTQKYKVPLFSFNEILCFKCHVASEI